MEIKPKQLKELAEQIYNGKPKELDTITGSYEYKGYRLQISKFKESNKERVLRLYRRRRANGLCIACGKPVKKTNPRTLKPYRLCEQHRQKIDLKKW